MMMRYERMSNYVCNNCANLDHDVQLAAIVLCDNLTKKLRRKEVSEKVAHKHLYEVSKVTRNIACPNCGCNFCKDEDYAKAALDNLLRQRSYA
jgi:DNA-directed RNA polymerase subunit RPC12/RpoP